MTIRVLTGVTPSGTLHLGNYVGCIRPAIQKSLTAETESFYFLSDYHALIKCGDADRVEKSRVQIAATWLACGLDPQKIHFYRQSDIPEIPELNWILNCVCNKGLMNRAHAYKAKVDVNESKGEDPDQDVTMGLFCYPILMAADILMFSANLIPVGKDQIQHIEMCRDIATRFNLMYGKGKDILTLPEAMVDAETELLPGLDGRKMSKSYNNVIPLFEGGEKALREAVMKIVTDSKLPGEAKDPDSTSLTVIYDAFANKVEREQFRSALRSGLSWGEAKEIVFRQINKEIAPKRELYNHLMSNPGKVEEILQEGASRIRPIARKLLDEVRDAVGLRTFRTISTNSQTKISKKVVKPQIKQYRENDLFYFKLLSAEGRLLMIGGGLKSGRDNGLLISRFKQEGLSALEGAFCQLEEGIDTTDITTALSQMLE
ncbi:MAG: tryptophan--tRNA ligase [Burkholderiaceae bacterium]|nr:tryptophan--tRNA ligase [Burkholderiaceae bacterium]